MTYQPFFHTSPSKPIPFSSNSTAMETTTKGGLKCVWSGSTTYDNFYAHYTGFNLSWKFDWDELKKDGIDGLSGHIIIKSDDSSFDPARIEVDLRENNQTIVKKIVPRPGCNCSYVSFEYSLIPHRTPIQEEEVSYDEMFFQSDQNDTILLIDGMKLYVNKAFLSYHSDFFRALFSSNFKEGQMDEIPIQDISYKDFGLVMSVVYPKVVFPNDKTVEKLLELADRFIMPSVIGHAEDHLLYKSKIENKKMIWMADQYGMPKLLKKCIQQIDTKEKAKQLKADPNWKNLSNVTKSAFLDRLMQLI